jgi:hypothetical protein
MAKVGRNDPCPCGSGRKYKKCCEAKQAQGGSQSRMLLVMVGGAIIVALALAVVSMTTEGTAGAGVRIWDPAHGHYHNANGVQVP